MNNFDRALQNAETPRSSIICDKCGTTSYVTDSRREWIDGCGNTMVRKRECRKCSHGWRTYEISQKNFGNVRIL